MKAYCTALMYSGQRNPDKNLTDEEFEHVKKLASQLSGTKIPKSNHGLGFTGFGVFSDNFGVFGLFSGKVEIWDEDTQNWIGYYDTVGLCAYLHTIMNDTLQKHYQQSNIAISNYQWRMTAYDNPTIQVDNETWESLLNNLKNPTNDTNE